MTKAMRVLMVSHAHPQRVAGGAQLVAYQLHQELSRHPGVESHLLAHAAPGKVRLATFGSVGRDGRQILFHGGALNPLLFSQENSWFVSHDFRELLERIRPDVVHFQHYAAVGVDLIREVRNWSQRVPMILTLHEYLAICHAGGQMLKNSRTYQLCHRADPRSCSECFPDISPEDFFLRELFLKAHFEQIDQFIAPSAFLKKRYSDWGLPPQKIEVLENGQLVPETFPARQARTSTHFAFIGKVFRVKGIFTLLDAIELLPPEIKDRCEFSIYGSGIEEEPYHVQAEFSSRRSRLGKLVPAYGSYAPEEISRLLAHVDWVVVPSIWWENSPMVIQEAFANKIPVICSNIGGMAEKVTDGVDGLHFRVNDPRDLARMIEVAVSTPGLRQKLVNGIRRPPSLEETARWHLSMYERLIAQRTAESAAKDAHQPDLRSSALTV